MLKLKYIINFGTLTTFEKDDEYRDQDGINISQGT